MTEVAWERKKELEIAKKKKFFKDLEVLKFQ